MKELFYNYIDWDNVGEEYRDRAVAQVDDAVILSEKNILKLSVRLNYVVPAKDEDKIKGIILNSVGDLKDVEFEYTYVNLILSDADALRLILPKVLRKLNEKNHYVAGSIDISSLKIEGKRVIISTVGELACKNLNGKASSQIALMIKNEIGLEYEIVFENDDKLYAEAHESLQKRSDDEIKELNEKTKEAAKAAASKPKAEEQKFQGGGNSGFRRKKNTKDLPAKGNIIMGEKAITLEITPLAELSPEQKQVAVAGILFDKDARTVRHENVLMSLSITDRKTSTCLKTFVSKQKWDEINSLLKEGTYIKAIGAPEWDTYENAITVRIDGIEKSSIKLREDNYDGQKRVELHCHTKMSAMDGLNDVETIVKTAARWGHPAVAITDHGVVQSFPDAASAAAKLAKDDINIKIIYGMEGYVFDDSDCVNEDGSIDYKKKGTNHIILLAATQEGLKNIYKMVSMSHIEYFYRKPRLPKSVISKYREGVIIGSACEAGEVYRAVSNNLSDAELDEIASFYDYLEIQPLINNQFMIEKRMVESREDLRNFNRRVLECGRRLGKMVVATTDAHYDEPESAIFRNIIMAGMGYKDAENGQGLYMRTTEEMLEEFSYLGDDIAYEIVVENPNKIADMISPDILPVPKGKYPPKIEGAEETLRKTCMDKVHEMYGENVPSEIEERLNKELDSIIGNG
ncbi:MAG: PHP domain-containing protein, partial [[Eubacterium] sulci]|nr:PHP domain-containing protein [[Eubacterium] sulci]